ncbi:AAA family ATPase [Pseudomonas shahriarae]|uniref:AAA family ATPase n=1 Tax=Pseudomonas shahriarae TaxID=2745512 RepID=UPI00249B4CA5|nr:AAA family ATPase [Pseudomonas shahriarae]MDI3206796.1 AAA family ATPase [Pseudomonas shahriarae]
MRLRYLNLRLYAPLSDIKVCFASDTAWTPFSVGPPDPCAIHFVVGLNGSGKSHLLRALAAIFVSLADGRLPGFSFSLIYELGAAHNQRTVIFNSPGASSEASVWQAEDTIFDKFADEQIFDSAIEALTNGENESFTARIAPGDYPQAVTDLLPKVLAYTSGSWDAWSEVWRPPLELNDEGFRFTEGEDFPFDLERPPGWTQQDEESLDNFENEPEAQPLLPHTYVDASDLLNRPILLSGNRPDAALLSVVLQGLQSGQESGPTPSLLAELYQKAGLHSLVSVRLRLDLNRALTAPRAMQQKIHDALLAAGEVIALPDPNDRLRALHFDIGAPIPTNADFLDQRLSDAKSQDEALTLLLGEQSQSAYGRFNELSRWLAMGLIEGVELSIRRSEKPGVDGELDIGIMSYSDLSDGEQMVLRRWALFQLLAEQQDALLLLDEPETHFNDAWKREIVHFIEGAMGKDTSHVLIASHSAIVLSDVFDEEIIHIVKKTDGSSIAQKVKKRTFGTDPSALMMDLFLTDDSIGMRAQRRIEAFTTHIRNQETLTAEHIAELKLLISRLGTGYYRSELQTLVRKHEQDNDTRALNQTIMKLESSELKTELLGFLHTRARKEGDDSA